MTVELANGKEVNHVVGTINFELGEKNTAAFFRTLPVRVYDRILEMEQTMLVSIVPKELFLLEIF